MDEFPIPKQEFNNRPSSFQASLRNLTNTTPLENSAVSIWYQKYRKFEAMASRRGNKEEEKEKEKEGKKKPG